MAKANIAQIKKCLEAFNLKTLFYEELGWNRLREASLILPHNGQSYTFETLAEKGGFKIYTCTLPSESFPNEKTLKQLDLKVEPYARERLLIFLDDAKTKQVWLWVKQEQGKPRAARINKVDKDRSTDLLAHKLAGIFIGLDEEESADLVMTYGRIKSGFDVDKVTTKFYERFKKEHASFLGHIRGIADDKDREWYASLMLNRLMFLYFIQKQGFLDNPSRQRLEGDRHYLRNHLKMTQKQSGENTFYTFYRYFLLCLFHDGLSQRTRTPALERIIGDVPYLNGGLFDVHLLEHQYQDIQIGDEAFESVFAFFDDFDWYLDDRPTRKGNEINPDVLGYIFEKYINQKQMGAYYTKEDITGYISKNTIIPFLFEKAMEQCPLAFTPDGPVWLLLREYPGNYIYDAVTHGVHEPLPVEIEEGITNVMLRTQWNRPAPETHALPTETWREVVARRQRYDEIYSRIITGQMTSINDLITYNLDISAFALDVITACEDPDLLLAFYNAVQQVTVLDPTCGSGAFLFAALNILQPLYQACLERMRILLAEHDRPNEAITASEYKVDGGIDRFRQILARVEQHHSQDYFILKSIIINNLYGVDIMAEAVEICKLRLFLKLVAQVTKPNELEPLPDIDFNILTGNTLIGFTNLDEVRQIVAHSLIAGVTLADALTSIEQQAKEIERTEQHFRRLQTEYKIDLDGPTLQECKQSLRTQLDKLRADLDHYLAPEYGIDHNSITNNTVYQGRYEQWQKSHHPFHWWVEFYEIINSGGFDVIIGNPPYVERSEFKKSGYTIKGFVTERCSDIYALFLERSIKLINSRGMSGFIIPISLVCADDFSPLQEILLKNHHSKWMAHFANRPSQLFVGAQKRLTILITKFKDEKKQNEIFTSCYKRWFKEERHSLLATLEYVCQDHLPAVFKHSLAKIGSIREHRLLKKAFTTNKRLSTYTAVDSPYKMYYVRTPGYFCQFLNSPPMVTKLSTKEKKPRGELYCDIFKAENVLHICMAVTNSTLFYWYMTVYSDCRHMNRRDVLNFPFDLTALNEEICQSLIALSKELQENYTNNKVIMYKSGLEIETFNSEKTKKTIDEIDRVLAQHYGFTDEELDFIINYDIKYRMGRNEEDEE